VDASATTNARGPEPHVLQVRIEAEDLEALRPFLLEGLDVGCRPHPVELPGGRVALQAYVVEDELARLRERGVNVEVIHDASALLRERQADVGQGDRFDNGRIAPHGLGVKTGGRPRAR
jgi:hypothetical protein